MKLKNTAQSLLPIQAATLKAAPQLTRPPCSEKVKLGLFEILPNFALPHWPQRQRTWLPDFTTISAGRKTTTGFFEPCATLEKALP
jgi:hypothetical protein